MIDNGTAKLIILSVTEALDELYSSEPCGGEFLLGQKYAFVECLEILQNFFPDLFPPEYDVEKKYPL